MIFDSSRWDKLRPEDSARIASNNSAKPIRFLFGNYFPFGELSNLVGAPGAGKGTLACYFAKRVTRGATPANVMVMSTEDSYKKVIIPRLVAEGADLTRVIDATGKKFYPERGGGNVFRPNDFEEFFKKMSERVGRIDLIIIDPLSQVIEGDTNNGSKARLMYEALSEFAERYDCVILGISHLVKNSKGKDPLARIAGPSATSQVPRFILMAVRNKEPYPDGATHTLIHIKSNIGKLQTADSYSIVEHKYYSGADEISTSKIEFHDAIEGSPEEILKRAEFVSATENDSKLDDAIEFLQSLLEDGPQTCPQVKDMAKEAGVSLGTLNRAKIELGVVSKKMSGVGKFPPNIWSLPDE